VITQQSPDLILQVKVKYTTWIAIGVATTKRVMEKNFKWDDTDAPDKHGTNHWSANGYLWTQHSNTHRKKTLPTYSTGDIIQFRFTPREGVFYMKKLSDRTWNPLPITYPVCLCAIMSSRDDSVEILQTDK
jgi:hypothetical protein